MMNNLTSYERPAGELHKVSIKKWNSVYASRGTYPLVTAYIYVQDNQAIVNFHASMFGLVLMWIFSPLFYIVYTIMYGITETHDTFLDVVFNKQRKTYKCDYVDRFYNGRVTESWIKLMKLLEK